MENKKAAMSQVEEEEVFSLKDFFFACLAQWKWFVISVIVFVGIGILHVITQEPGYSRKMQLLIQDSGNASSGFNVASAFQDMGFGGAGTNVYNELVSLKSPAVMYEVVKRLHLNVDMAIQKFPHQKTLYGKSAPFVFVNHDTIKPNSFNFEMRLQPDNSYTLEKFVVVDKATGDKQKFGDVIKGKLSFDAVKTPGGVITLHPNVDYTKERDKEVVIKVWAGSIDGAVETYSGKLKADLTDADSEVIDLSITDVNVQRAADVLETVVEVYNEFWVRDKNRMAIATSKFIEDRLNKIVEELSEVDSDIAGYQSANKIPDVVEASKSYYQEGSVVSKEILEVTNKLAMAKYIRDFVSNPSNANQVVPVNSGIGNTTLELAIKEYNTLLLTRNNLAENSGENNPIMATYNAQAKGMRESLLKSLNTQVGTLQANLANLESARGVNETQLSKAPEQAKYLGAIKRDQAVKESLYLYLLERREENNLTQAFNAYNTRIITPPYGTNVPVSPKKMMTVVMCVMLGLLIPAVALYFAVVSDTKVRSRRDMENLPIPFTGEIPQIGRRNKWKRLIQTKKGRQKEIDTPKPIVAEGKRDVPNEAFRVVRSNIDLMLDKNIEHPVLMVTSFNPGSGKSFIAYNLGASFALKRKRVLLIDGDLRHGSLSTYVGSPRKGVATFLSGTINDAKSIIYPVENMHNLSIMPIGKRPPNPAELLEGNRFGELLESVKGDYDIVMVDCPPVNVVVDTQLLNRYADATIFVVRAGLLEKSAIKDLTELYGEKKLKRMSILLNGTDVAHSSYYTYGNYQSLEE